MAAMFRYIESGSYVADTTRQTQLFGPPPTAGTPSLACSATSAI